MIMMVLGGVKEKKKKQAESQKTKCCRNEMLTGLAKTENYVFTKTKLSILSCRVDRFKCD